MLMLLLLLMILLHLGESPSAQCLIVDFTYILNTDIRLQVIKFKMNQAIAL